MIDEIVKDAGQRMDKSVSVLGDEFAKIRTGRAHSGLLDHVHVNYYGADVPLNQAANISVEDARTLTIQPWEKSMVSNIEKAIQTANLGLNPSTAGTVIRVILPPLTEERRRDLVRVVRKEAEDARVAIRNIRRDANQDFKDLAKEKEASEDEARAGENRVQELTDKFVARIDSLLERKEQDMMTV